MLKSKLRAVAAVGLSLSLLSLVAHFLLVRHSVSRIRIDEPASWPSSVTKSYYGKAWSPAVPLNLLRPNVSPRTLLPGPSEVNNGFLFVRIKGEFHNIHASICDVVAVTRLLNATLVLPELHEISVAKGIHSGFKNFGYIYDEDHFISVLASDVLIVKNLPKQWKSLKRSKMMVFKFPSSNASPNFYLEKVLPDLKSRGLIGIIVSGGGCLESALPRELVEYQRLRCRVSFQALQFRRQVRELGLQMVKRLQALGQPYLAFHTGLELEALAYHGCAERFQDIHTELIQHKRAQMIKKGIVKRELHIDSELQRKNGQCPIMPEEVGVLLRSLGYGPHTRIYLSGTEVFGGQRVLIPLHAMFSNLEDRMTITAKEERVAMFGPEEPLPESPPPRLILNDEKARLEAWAKAGPRPRPLPPPPGRPKFSHEVEGWWGWIGESDMEPSPTLHDLRERGHTLLWAALDYIVCVEANAFFPGFDQDKNGKPNFASIVMGHRSYKSAWQRTYRLDRKVIVKQLDDVTDLYHPSRSWVSSMRDYLKETAGLAGFATFSQTSKAALFLSHPHPECSCEVVGHNGSFNWHTAMNNFTLPEEEKCPDWVNAGTNVVQDEDVMEEDYTMDELDSEFMGKPMFGNADKEEFHVLDAEEVDVDD